MVSPPPPFKGLYDFEQASVMSPFVRRRDESPFSAAILSNSSMSDCEYRCVLLVLEVALHDCSIILLSCQTCLCVCEKCEGRKEAHASFEGI